MGEPAVQTNQGPGKEQAGSQVLGRDRRRPVVWIVLVAYTLLLGCRAFWHGAEGWGADIALWELHDPHRVLAWIGHLVPAAVFQCVAFVPIGLMAALLVPCGASRLRRRLIRLCARSIAATIAGLIYGAELVGSGRPAVVFGLVFPLLGCLLGTALGAAWLRDRRARLWFIPKIALTIVLAALGLGILIWPFLEATHTLRIDPDAVEVTYGHVHVPPELRREFFRPAAVNEEVLASTRAQIDHLLAAVKLLPRSQLTFGFCFETVFAFARDRSLGRNPVLENKAGIFALGILLGHHRIEELLGLTGGDTGRAARKALARIDLRGRSDWTKHFCVSAVLAVLSDDAVSDAAGLLKEELDADTGGSGFSFSDLLADRAGTTFGLQATRDETAARGMQSRLAGGFRVDEFFPVAADLPEGIPDAQLRSHYGGVGGEGYNRLVEEIERRIAGCAAYR